jgi:hypothetical protein
MSNTLLLKKSSIAGRIPLAGDLEYGELALNYADGKLYYKTSSNTVANLGGDTYVQIDRKSYTATAGQTTFSITYALPYVDVYVNGVHMSDEDYAATNGTSIVLVQACSAGDQVDLMGFSGTLISPSQKTNGEVLVYNGTTRVWDNVAQSTLTAGNATKWATARNLSLTGDATATLTGVDGSAAVSAALTLATVNANVGSFGSTTAIPIITVNAKGLVTGVTTASISGSISVTGGDLTLSGNTGTAITNATLATVNSNVGTFGSSTSVPVVTVNSKGLVTSVTTANISGALTFTGDVTGSGTTGTSTALTISPLAVTNSMLAGSIANAKLSNSAITIGSTSIALGATSTTLAGLTSVTSTGFTGALTGNADTATALATARNIQGVSFDGSAAITVVTAGTGVSVSGTAVSIGQAVGTGSNVTFNDLTVNGNLTVSGTTTSINTTTLNVADLNITVANGAATAAAANGAGLTVNGPVTPATLTYTSADDRWNLNKNLNVTTVYGALSGNASTATALATGRTIAITGDIAYTSGSFDGTGNVTGAGTLATVNSNVGSFGSASAVPVITVNAKGLVTSVTTTAVAGVSNVTYNTSTGVLQIDTSNGSTYTVDVGVGTSDSPTFATSITLNNSRLESNTTTTTATTADQVLVSLAGASYRSAEFQIQATDATGSKYHTATIKALHNGTSAVHTEFSSLNIGGVCATFNVDYSGGNLRLLCTPSSANSTVFKITSIIGKV